MLRIVARQSGFSVVELLVASAIALFLAGGVVSVYVASKRGFHHQRQLSRLQENARIALDRIGRDVRNAGYAGCAGGLGAISTGLAPVPGGDLPDISFRIEGVEEGGTAWLPGGSILDAAQSSRYGDAVTLRYMGAPRHLLRPMGVPADPVEPVDAAGFSSGQIVMISDCVSGEIFRVTSDPSVDGVLRHDTGGVPGNVSSSLGKAYGRDAMVGHLVAVRYFVYENKHGERALFRSQIGTDAAGNPVTLRPPASPETEVTGGVDAIQIRYGVDRDGDGVPDVYERASAVGGVDAWGRVVSVRVGMVVNGEIESGLERDTNVYNVLGDPVNGGQPFGDRRLRKVVIETFSLRND